MSEKEKGLPRDGPHLQEDVLGRDEARELEDVLVRQAQSSGAGARSAREQRPEDVEEIYQRFRRMARGLLDRERADHTLQPTALAHEAWVRLKRSSAWEKLAGSPVLYQVAGLAMRHILRDHWRDRSRTLAGIRNRIPFAGDEPADARPGLSPEDRESLERALDRLGLHKPRACLATRLHYFNELSVGEVAEILDVGETAVRKDLALARAWLFKELRVEFGWVGHEPSE